MPMLTLVWARKQAARQESIRTKTWGESGGGCAPVPSLTSACKEGFDKIRGVLFFQDRQLDPILQFPCSLLVVAVIVPSLGAVVEDQTWRISTGRARR